MKKVLIATGIAALAFAAVASAAFSVNLTVGSTGPDVVALQTWLVGNGYSIPAIQSGVAQKGYFGSQTKAAVQAYQTAKSIPSTGFVGPLTRGALNAGGGVVVTPGVVACPTGYTCTPVAGTTPPVTGTPGTITTTGIAGTLAVSLQGSPSGASLDKGESEDVVRYKLQAAASDEQVTSISLDFDTRLWLIAGSITIKDDSGAVIVSKNLTSTDFTELTVGSSYRLYVPVNYIIPKAQTRYFTATLSMLPISDRSAATVTITQAQFRAVDGTGVSDTQTVTDDRTFSYTGSNTGSIITTLNASSPLKRLVQISNSTKTEGVVLAKYDLKSQNRQSTLRTLKVYVNTDGTSVNTLFSRFQIQAGGMTYTANTTSVAPPDTTASSTLTFTDLTIPLPKDVYTTITVLADVAQPSSSGALDGKSASTTIKANTTNTAAEDSTYNTVTVNAATLTSSDAIFSASGAVLSSMSATLGSPVLSGDVTVAQPVSFTYTLQAGDNTLYVAEAPTTALGTTTTGYTSNTNASTTITSVTATPSEVAGDSSGTYFVVPAGGSRTFRWSGTIKNDPPSGVVQRTFKISTVFYDTNTTNLNDNSINYNLGSLKVEPVI